MTPTITTLPPRLKKVPPFPPIAARLLAMMSHPLVEIPEVAELIASDSTFTARVLQRVNSAAFCLTQSIDNVQHAVSLMGIGGTREVVVTYGAGAFATGGLRTAEMRSCWQHSIATAVLADEIARSCGAYVSSAFTAGIMHDIGRLGLLAAYPKEYERMVRDSAERCIDLLDFESQEFGLHHAEAGRMLAEMWGLPDDLRIIAGRHHDPCEGRELDLLRIVHVACRLAQVLGYDLVRPVPAADVDAVLAELPPPERARIKATPEQLWAQVERRILEYDVEEGANPREAPAAAQPEAENRDDLEEAAESEEEQPAPLVPPPAPHNGRTTRITIAVFALIIAAALTIWRWFGTS